MNYNLYGFPDSDVAKLYDEVPETEIIAFNLERHVLQQHREGDIDLEHYVPESTTLEIPRDMFDPFPKLLSNTLGLAVTYFLLGCENPRYFLVEFYKAVEVIKKEFGTEKAMTGSLNLYGFTKKSYQKLRKYANDDRKPLSIVGMRLGKVLGFSSLTLRGFSKNHRHEQ